MRVTLSNRILRTKSNLVSINGTSKVMYFAHIFSFLAAIIVSIFQPAGYSTQKHSIHATVLGKSIENISQVVKPSSVTIPSVIPVFSQTIQHSLTPVIDCVGPDGKHLVIPQKACDDFNNAWHNHQFPSPTSPWGIAQKIAEHTYTMKFTPDIKMATAQEIFDALNTYRENHGVHSLQWSTALATYAQTRSDFFYRLGTLDQHAGFTHYLHNEDGFNKLGFNNVGENASYAGPLLGIHLIEWIFGGDEEHNANQLNAAWQYVGIGVDGIATDIIFSANKKI